MRKLTYFGDRDYSGEKGGLHEVPEWGTWKRKTAYLNTEAVNGKGSGNTVNGRHTLSLQKFPGKKAIYTAEQISLFLFYIWFLTPVTPNACDSCDPCI